MNQPICIRSVRPTDIPALLAIYAPYVTDTAISFDYEVPTLEEFAQKFEQLARRYPCLAAVKGEAILGYAYAAPFKERAAYDRSVELTIYLAAAAKGGGVGRQLYQELERKLADAGVLNLNACIALPRDEHDPYVGMDSILFHRAMGFRQVAHFHGSGYKFGRWYDMIWMEKLIGEHQDDFRPSDFAGLLQEEQDNGYRQFQQKLMPTVDPQTVIGVRTPVIKKLAAQLWRDRQEDCERFLCSLPHAYFEENQLHAQLLMKQTDFDCCLALTESFLPYINNWATCDTLMPAVFKKNPQQLLPYIRRWLTSGHTYVCRFGIGCLLSLFLDEHFRPEYLAWVADLRSSEYYVNMMIAWYFAEALVKRYETAIDYLRENRLEQWTHNKAIQKAVESFRISDNRKEELRGLRRKTA